VWCSGGGPSPASGNGGAGGGGGLAYDSGNNLYANAHADADVRCPAARKQETNYAREQL